MSDGDPTPEERALALARAENRLLRASAASASLTRAADGLLAQLAALEELYAGLGGSDGPGGSDEPTVPPRGGGGGHPDPASGTAGSGSAGFPTDAIEGDDGLSPFPFPSPPSDRGERRRQRRSRLGGILPAALIAVSGLAAGAAMAAAVGHQTFA